MKVLGRAVFVLMLLAMSAAATTIYQQPSNYGQGNMAYPSTYLEPPTDQYAATLDNFTLNTTSTFNTMTWEGGYIDAISHQGVNGDTNLWGIAIFADSGGIPDFNQKLYNVNLTPNQVSVTDLGQKTIGLGVSGLTSTTEVYSFSAAIPAFTAQAGTRYWIIALSQQPDTPQILFMWSGGTGGDNQNYQYGQIYNGLYPGDMAFSLQEVPEPTSLTMLATGVIGAVGVLRRKLL